MKLIYSRLLAFICFITSIGILVSCEKDEPATNAGKVQLLSFGPTGAKHGDTLRFIGTSLTSVTAIHFAGTNAIVEQKDFKKVSSDLILVIVPETAEKGYVTLKTAAGDIVSKTQLNLGVTSSVTTMTAQARPGENITITGKFLNWVNRITFANDKVVETFVSKSQNQIVVTVPADAQTGPLIISYGGTDSTNIQTADTLKITLPVATGLSPDPVKHAENLTITGTDLDLAKQVIFTGVSAPVTTFVSQSATQLVVKVPGNAQKGKITLVAASGVKTLSSTELNLAMPSITSLSPSPVDPGAQLTITGTNLDLVTGISFVGVTNAVTTFVSKTPTQIVVTVPSSGVLKGKLTFSIMNSTLTVQSPTELVISGGLPPLADFAFPIYTDGANAPFQDWSYTVEHNFNSTANVRQGTKSIKAVYGGNTYQALNFHAAPDNSGPNTSAYTKIEFSVFGEAGTGGKKLNVIINGNYGSPAAQVTILEGEWATFSISLSSLGSPAQLNEFILQSAGWTGTIHIDHVGLR